MNTQKIKDILKDPRTNWKYIGVVAILAFIAGAVIMSCLSKTGFEIPNIVLPERKGETANWKTYRNDEYGFEIRYPQDWRLEENTDPTDKSKRGFEEEVSFVSPLEWEISIPPEYEKEILSFYVTFTIFEKSKWRAMSEEAMNPCEATGVNCEEVVFGSNIPAFAWESVTDVAYHVMIYTPKDQFFILINGVAGISPWEIESFNQILSTFKFLD